MSGSRRKFASRKIALFLAVFGLSSVLGSGAARAADEVDWVVDAFAGAGYFVGVSLGPTEKTLVKSLVRCATGGKPLLTCARDEVTRPLLSQLPADMRPVATCLINGTAPEKCATEEVLRRLPVEARGIAQCIGAGRDLGQCGREFATQGTLKQAFDVINGLQVDAVIARNPMIQTGRTIQNILCTVQAANRNDWAKVVECSGREVAKAVYKAILQAFVPVPGLVSVLSDVIDGMIERRFDMVVEIMKAARPPNTRRLAEIAAEAFILFGTPLGQAATVICDFMPSGAVKEVVCGAIGDAIRWATKAPGAILGGVVDVAEDVGRFFGGNQCRAAPHFYQDIFGSCIPWGVWQMVEWSFHRNPDLGASYYNNFENEVYAQCRRNVQSWYRVGVFGTTSTSQCASNLCDPLRDRFGDQAYVLAQAVIDTGYAFGRAARYSARMSEIGSSGRWQCQRWGAEAAFQTDCLRALERQFPYLTGGSGAPSCNVWGTQVSGSGTLFTRVCSRVLERVGNNRIVCECPEGMTRSRTDTGEPTCLPPGAIDVYRITRGLPQLLPLTESPSSLSTSATLDSVTRPLPTLVIPEETVPSPVSVVPGIIQPTPSLMDRFTPPPVVTPENPSPVVVPLPTLPPIRLPEVEARTCDVAACRAAYRSFRESDCTYQPLGGGPRQYCDRASTGGGMDTVQPSNVCPPDRPVGKYPNCCPSGTEFSGGVCRAVSLAPPPELRTCPRDRPVGTFPNCCPRGMEFRNGACHPRQVAEPCPAGQRLVRDRRGRTRCEPEQRAEPASCPPGQRYVKERRGRGSCVADQTQQQTTPQACPDPKWQVRNAAGQCECRGKMVLYTYNTTAGSRTECGCPRGMKNPPACNELDIR